jgi:hypothetical protein
MSNLENILLIVLAIMAIKIIKELEYIRLYTLMFKFNKEEKLIPENDPKGLADEIAHDLKKSKFKYL